jgi:hypothetical protein
VEDRVVNHRIVWSVAGVVAALGLLVFGISTLSAQRPPAYGFPMMGVPQVGRFTVAHATATKVIILDTMTGQVYKAEEGDFKKASSLPKVGEGFRPTGPPDFKDKAKPFFQDKRKGQDRREEKQ